MFFLGWRGGGGARVGEYFFTKNPNLKKKYFGVGRWGVGAGWGVVDGWTVERAQTNLPVQFLRSWGHNNALMYKLCP